MDGDRTVLVVDDNPENRALARATLEDEGYRVVLANDGESALAAFVREAPACILLDIRMPGMDGVTACERLRALPGGGDVAIVFVTAQRDVDTFDRAVQAGGDDFLTKPFRPGELLVRVQTALRLRHIAVERSGLYAQIKQQRDELQRMQLEKEQLVAFLVHDLKNPVHSIELHAQLVLRDKAATDKTRRAATSIHDESRALLRMLTNLLDISKADEGRFTPAREAVDVPALVRNVIGEMAVRASASGVALASEVTAPSLQGDPDLMHRVLANLIENAIRHSPEGAEVRVAIAAVTGGIELRVSDRGPGVPQELREQVFARFERGSQSATRSNRGLGLAFCKLAVEAQGGRIWIEDATPGAVFCVRITDVA